MSDYDVIIVGGGVAGCTAAYILAKAGLEVVLVERGNFPGSKNVTGGRLYAHSLEKIMPNFAAEAPVERKVTKERISLTTGESAFTIDFSSDKLGVQGQDSYVVCRSSFDRWLSEQAENEGAMIVSGIRVDDLMVQDGKVCGIVAGGDEMTADVVILADGVNSLLAQKIGMKKELLPSQVAVGAKEVIEFSEKEIESRFNLNPGEGMSWLFAGQLTDGAVGGGFLYTNKDSVSLGVLATLSELHKANKTVPQMLEELKQHPAVRPLIAGGKLVEYSGHLVPEGGISMVPELYRDGVLVVGDAAGFVINIGFMVRGMDLAIGSAAAAAQAVLEAKEKGDYSAETLRRYVDLLEEDFVMRDMRQYKNFPAFMESCDGLFTDYPVMLENILSDMFIVNGQKRPAIKKMLLGHASDVGLMRLAKDGLKGVKAL